MKIRYSCYFIQTWAANWWRGDTIDEPNRSAQIGPHWDETISPVTKHESIRTYRVSKQGELLHDCSVCRCLMVELTNE